jgi:UDP-4-amino-4-deoxy-L-arabinose formyltransferase/UDP-glucuronic acid dehydrogenase (UDP-4-keto-hexauronic acid decarboxylating)
LTTAADDPAAIPSIPQDLTRRQYRGREIPQEGRIDWAKTARETVDFVRACDYGPYPSPWGRPQTTLGGVDVSVLKAARTGMASSAAPGTVGDVSGRGVMVSGDDEWVLVQRLSVNGRGVDAADVLGGHERLDAAPALI